MKENRVKRVMREGGLAIVSHVGFSDPAVVEIIAAAGFDRVRSSIWSTRPSTCERSGK